MSNQAIQPGEAPPAYSQAVYERDGHLAAPATGAGHSLATPTAEHDAHDYASTDEDGHSDFIPEDQRHSFENATRELPEGWIRQFDPKSDHVYFVDTRAKPPRSTWVHPYDDPEYLMSLPHDDPKRVAYEQSTKGAHGKTAAAGSSSHHHGEGSSTHSSKDEKRTLGRKMKDKLTGTTHEQRVKERERQRELQRKQYEEYMRRRAELIEAQRNGTYQPMYGPPMGGMYSRPVYQSPYGYTYARPGYGYGGGYGYGRGGMGYGGAALGAGVLGGMLLGGALF